MDGGLLPKLGISLRALLPDAEIVGADDIVVSHCSADSGTCREGDLFVAPADASADGYESVREALQLGAKAVVASHPLPQCTVPVCYVTETGAAYGLICQALAGFPARRLKTIGVAGAFGKTTTGYLIASVLAAAGRSPGVLSSLGYCDGVEIADARWTTPPAHVAAAWLARMVEHERTHVVAEISGRGLLEHRLAGIDLDCLCVTNLRSDEHELHGSPECRRMKSRLLEQLLPEGMLIVNVDDPAVAELADRHGGPMLSVGIDQPAEISAVICERHRSEQTFLLSFGREVVPVRTTLVGRHNVLNCLSAAAVGAAYGISPPTIARGLEDVRELPGRLERVECGQPFGVFVDEGLAPEALTACLAGLRETAPGRLFCVFNASPIHNRPTRIRLAQAVEQWCDRAVVTRSAHGFDANSTADVAAAFRTAGKCSIVDDRAEAVRRVLEEARDGDCVLIAGRGSATYALADREQDYWDDRQLARQVLYQLKQADAPVRRAA